MGEAIRKLEEELQALVKSINNHIPGNEPFNIAHGGWNIPGLSRLDLLTQVDRISYSLVSCRELELEDYTEASVLSYTARLEFVINNTLPNLWGNPAAAVQALVLTLDGLESFVKSLQSPDDLDKNREEVRVGIKEASKQLRSMQSRLRTLQPRFENLDSMLSRIEEADRSAHKLPEDLESLAEARGNIADLLKQAIGDQAQIEIGRSLAENVAKDMKDRLSAADAVLERCEKAYSAATSVGLAAAFTERSRELGKSMWVWVGFLLVSLIFGGWVGSVRLHELSEVLGRQGSEGWMVTLNILMSLLSIGAPLWFAWLSTKQIGQRFRLSEDYGYKASISRAYEGFRREAARIDADMEARLLSSALSRLDELPLRLVENESHGSPWHELASSDVVKRAIDTAPGFSGMVKDLAGKVLSLATPAAGAVATVATSVPRSTAEEPSANQDQKGAQ